MFNWLLKPWSVPIFPFQYSPGGLLLGEYQSDGTRIREYVYLNGQPLALIAVPYQGGGPYLAKGQSAPTPPAHPSAPSSTSGTAQIYYYQNDHLGAPEVLTDSAGNVAWEVDRDPFGNDRIVTQKVINPLRLPGQ